MPYEELPIANSGIIASLHVPANIQTNADFINTEIFFKLLL